MTGIFPDFPVTSTSEPARNQTMRFTFQAPSRCLAWGLLLCWSAFIGAQNGQAQQATSPTFLEPLETYSSLLPEEKIYLHLDKTHYVPGDTIWFAAYVTAGALHVPSPLSKVLYVDFLSNEGQLLEQKKVKIEQGAGKGEFRTQRFQSEGHYHIRAYTHWMKGFDSYPDFQQRIQILEPYNLSFQAEPSITWEANGPTFMYTVDFKARNERNAPLASESLRYEVVGKGEPSAQGLTGTTSAGEGTFRFELSEEQLREAPELRLFLDENEEFSIQRSFKLPLPDA
ncbi:hypothetical protein A3SI_18116 [Nitritalea halalkaliphila LW7]|uniref:Macroglobulin domain-containing protein n=1 Tax=Nitritalea halalkaliphila LW7 TaxID=1189621 RepID=I5BUV2_9BACT|nr:hypothetical protein [Nitritalea halalkaliphila]EIM73354.1 hypothetical protein A3SI_18116 [Nitritalea halalkaliphila LW7]